MAWPTVKVGRVSLQERLGSTDTSEGVRRLSLTGQESAPPTTPAELRARHDDLLGLRGRVVGVAFEQKATLNGFYLVESVEAGLTDHAGAVLWSSWSVGLRRLGDEGLGEVESRLIGGDRPNDHSLTGERWHAPSATHANYFTGETAASILDRTGEAGDVTVYRDVPDGVSPRWATSPEDYYSGAAELRVNDLLRAGHVVGNEPEAWELSNGLVKVAPESGGGGLEVSHYTDGAWVTKDYEVEVNSVVQTDPWTHLAVLRNDPEEVVIRLERGQTGGKLSLDINLKRGSLFASCFLRRHAAATLTVARASTEAATAFTGGIRATSNDGDGNRYTLGSARSFTSDLVEGKLSKASTRELGFFIGTEVDGSSAQAGDAAADLMAQYLGTPAETSMVVKR